MPINATLSSDGWHVPPITSLGGGVQVSAGTNIASTGTALFSNSNGITFGMNTNNVVTASVAGTVAGGSANVNLSAGTTSNASSAFTFSNSNGVSFGLNAGTITASHNGLTTAAQSNHSHGNPSLALTNLSGTTASASNGLTLSLAAAALALSAAGGSASAGTMVLSDSNGISFGANGSTITASHNGLTTAAQSNHSHGNPTLALTNLSGTTASASNGLTLSLSAAAQSNQVISAYAVSNTTQGTSGTIDARSLSVHGAGAASVGVSNGSLVVSVQAGAQSNQTMGLYGSSQTTGQSSSSTVDARSLTIAGMGGVSVGMSAGSLVISGNTGGGAGGAAVSAGTQSVNTGTVVWSNSNGVSFGMSGSSRVTASFALSNQAISAFAVSNTTQSTSGTVNVSAMSIQANGLVSAGISNGSIVISAPDTTSFAPLSVGFSTGGNTAGDTGFGTDRVVFVGGANVTLSGSTNGGSQTISVIGAAAAAGVAQAGGTQTATSGTVVFSNSNGISFGLSGSTRMTASFALSNQVVSAYAVSNTTQSTTGTVNVSAMSFHGAGGVSVGVSNGSVVISGGAAAGGYSAGLSNIGNTAGDTGVVTGRLVLAGLNATLSGSTNGGSMTATLSVPATSSLSGTGLLSIATNGSTISMGVPGDTMSRYGWPPAQAMNISSSANANSIYSLQYVSVQAPIAFTRMDVPLLVSLNTAAQSNTAAVALSAMLVLYSRTGSTMNPIVGASASSTFSWASNSSNFDRVSGGRNLSFGIASTLTPGEYYAGLYLSTTSGISSGAATTALDATFSVMFGSTFSASVIGAFNVATANGQGPLMLGVLSSVPTNTSQSVQSSQFTVTGTAVRANVPLLFRNY
jgi:fibronectin-binding autotransporter adhesin